MAASGTASCGRCRRVVVIVLDGVGVGALPDAVRYGDGDADTLGNLARAVGGLDLPVLESLGLGAAASIAGLGSSSSRGAYGRMEEVSTGKDSTTGHWELAGVVTAEPFATFPEGFPQDFVRLFENATGRKVIGNRPASGTEIIARLGERHLREKSLILYTSSDSVLQLAAHEDVLSAEQLYDLCRRSRRLLDDQGLAVLRVIARPFRGSPGAFVRFGRKDYSLPPPAETVFERLRDSGCPVLGVGKVGDLFCGRGFDEVREFSGNAAGLELVREALECWPEGAVMANLLDFDTLYGHRNDVDGFAASLTETDSFLGREILPRLAGDDLLVLTADHGCDPTLAHTDHTREYVPLLVTSGSGVQAVDLGVRKSFCDVGATVLQALTAQKWHRGRSFLRDVLGSGEPAD